MKIFYAIQATGNGHISRAMELLPFLQQYGKVDCFLSGNNSSLKAQLPIKYHNKGLSFFYSNNGSLDIFKTARNINLANIFKTARDLPLHQYDLIINDFEAITAYACKLKKIPSIHFGHQASFASSLTPRPAQKSKSGEFILKNFAPASLNIGLHFKPYDHFILPPIIKTEIQNATPQNLDYITVYLPSFSDQELLLHLQKIPHQTFQIFSKEVKSEQQIYNCHFIPIDKLKFNTSLINCKGIIANAGFETPAEALFLNKKIFVIPIGGQYEQACNAAALQHLGAYTIQKITSDFVEKINEWLAAPCPNYNNKFFLPTEIIVEKMMSLATKHLNKTLL